MSYFLVKQAGFLSTIQDLGRFGYGDIGISQSGAMDEEAFLWANKLLQNHPNSNMLEITYGNVELISFTQSIFCITGASAPLYLNKQKINSYQCYKIDKGDRIKIGFVQKGVRLYFAIKDGFLEAKELNSASVSVKEQIKSPLKNGDKLFCKKSTSTILSYLKKEYIPKYSNHLRARVTLGYEYQEFSKEALSRFFQTNFIIKSHNRMGYFLSSPTPIQSQNIEIISNPISFGAIQITKSGEPIILLKERQSIGGYPKIGSVLPIDCFRLSQLKEGDSISFEPISLQEATKITRKFYKSFL